MPKNKRFTRLFDDLASIIEDRLNTLHEHAEMTRAMHMELAKRVVALEADNLKLAGLTARAVSAGRAASEQFSELKGQVEALVHPFDQPGTHIELPLPTMSEAELREWADRIYADRIYAIATAAKEREAGTKGR